MSPSLRARSRPTKIGTRRFTGALSVRRYADKQLVGKTMQLINMVFITERGKYHSSIIYMLQYLVDYLEFI